MNKITEQKSKTLKIKDKNVRDFVNKFPRAFTWCGKIEGSRSKLNIDDKVIPIAQPQWRIPFHVRDKVKDAIEKLEKEGIIKSARKSTHPMGLSGTSCNQK